MWTKMMVRVWAVIHEPEYRERAVLVAMIFTSAFVLICDISTLASGGKLSLLSWLMLAVLTMVGIYSAIVLKRRVKNGNEKDEG